MYVSDSTLCRHAVINSEISHIKYVNVSVLLYHVFSCEPLYHCIKDSLAINKFNWFIFLSIHLCTRACANERDFSGCMSVDISENFYIHSDTKDSTHVTYSINRIIWVISLGYFFKIHGVQCNQ